MAASASATPSPPMTSSPPLRPLRRVMSVGRLPLPSFGSLIMDGQPPGNPASYQADHHIRNCGLLHVLWDQRQCDVAGHTDEQANMRERSRCDVRAHRVVCRESTPAPRHHHQHQDPSFQSYHVAYFTMTNTNTQTITCLCYSARRNMLDPQTSLDSIFFPIPSFMA